MATIFKTKFDLGKQAKIQKMSYCSIKSDIFCLEDWLHLSCSSRKHILQFFKFLPLTTLNLTTLNLAALNLSTLFDVENILYTGLPPTWKTWKRQGIENLFKTSGKSQEIFHENC